MTWPCKMIDNPELDEHGNVDFSKRAVGDMWFLDVPADELKDRHLSDQYFADNAGRKPLIVMLPGPTYFSVDGKCFSSEKGYYDGWTVTGAPPFITVKPSINVEGRYHGYLTAGVIGDPV